ncbi:hypothetical protein J6590_042503 [Homalodisca vitripennis]|nr:hypothetical protein J6590_042503 [Homalodisca vitripennis]
MYKSPYNEYTKVGRDLAINDHCQPATLHAFTCSNLDRSTLLGMLKARHYFTNTVSRAICQITIQCKGDAVEHLAAPELISGPATFPGFWQRLWPTNPINGQ